MYHQISNLMKENASNSTFDSATPPGSVDAVPDALPNAAYVRDWRQTSSLTLLRELTDVSASVAPTIARRANLSHSELRALELLVGSPLGLVELARELGVTPAASSAIADRLAARGHVLRKPHHTDGRRTQLVVTDSGREEVLGYLIPMFAGLREVDATLTVEERAVVDRFLTGCLEAIRRVL